MLGGPMGAGVLRQTNLDHCVPLNIIFESLQLKVEHWREFLEYDAFLGILQAQPFSLVFVITLQSFHGDIILERLVKIRHPFHI